MPMWSEKAMALAVKSVEEDQSSILEAAYRYLVPKKSLRQRLDKSKSSSKM